MMKINKTVQEATPKDYEKFKFITANRDHDPIHKKNVGLAISDLNLLKIPRVLVEEVQGNYLVHDGQHTVEAAKKLGLNFAYLIGEDFPEHMMIHLNTTRKNWTLTDYAKYWAAKSKTSKIYSEFLEIKKDYGISNQVLIAIYNMRCRRNQSLNTEFKKGRLRLPKLNKEHRDTRLSQINKLNSAPYERHLLLKTRRCQFFHEALLSCLEDFGFNYKKFTDSLLKHPNQLDKFKKIIDLQEEMYRLEAL
jgi:hypothetical protein